VTETLRLSQGGDFGVLDGVVRANRPDLQREATGFERLYGAYRSRVYGFLFRMSGVREDADDLFQETWLRVARTWADRGTAGIADEAAWLFTIARNVFLSGRRASAAKARGVERLRLVPAAASPSPERISAASQEIVALEEAMTQLSEDDRAILWLVAGEGLEQQQVARVLGIGYAAVRQRLARARERLADLLARARMDGDETTTRKERLP
jgi:RNA polymerase sigma-70 factor (ECF subfamily)